VDLAGGAPGAKLYDRILQVSGSFQPLEKIVEGCSHCTCLGGFKGFPQRTELWAALAGLVFLPRRRSRRTDAARAQLV
jgi:hypothetical protein